MHIKQQALLPVLVFCRMAEITRPDSHDQDLDPPGLAGVKKPPVTPMSVSYTHLTLPTTPYV